MTERDSTTSDLTARLKTEAFSLGFDACGIARADAPDPDDRLGEWIARGFHADMDWITRTRDLRQDVQQKLPGAQSVIVVARNYYHPPPEQPDGTGKVARYAWGRDYHKVVKKPLVNLARWLDATSPGTSYPAVDSGPVLERSWAERAGLGWIGKNSLVLRRDLGSWFFLGVILTTTKLDPDEAVVEHCGSCRACIDACPTDAIVDEQVVDARRCISYHTIENRDLIPEDLQADFGDWIFGCDICQEVCPWNRFAKESDAPGFAVRPGVPFPRLDELVNIDEDSFDERFAGSAIRRAKATGMRRNAAIAIMNQEKKNG